MNEDEDIAATDADAEAGAEDTELEADAERLTGATLRQGIELVQDTRLRLRVNVSEELALEALAYRLETSFT